MDTAATRDLLERLTGQPAPFSDVEAIHLFGDVQSGLGYSQLNELLLLFGFDRITHPFFRFLLDGGTTYEEGQAFTSHGQLSDGVTRFRKLAILLYGNVKFAFKSLSRDADLLVSALENLKPIPEQSFASRHNPMLPVSPIPPEDAYLTGYLIEHELNARLAGC